MDSLNTIYVSAYWTVGVCWEIPFIVRIFSPQDTFGEQCAGFTEYLSAVIDVVAQSNDYRVEDCGFYGVYVNPSEDSQIIRDWSRGAKPRFNTFFACAQDDAMFFVPLHGKEALDPYELSNE